MSAIPQDLKDLKIWTVSGADKIPLDPYELVHDVKLGYTPARNNGKLVRFDDLDLLLDKAPDLMPTMHLTESVPYIVMDIEKAGMHPNNPYRDWPFSYQELSRHNGLHGLIPVDKTKPENQIFTKTAIKDHVHNSEFLLNNHFITLTQNELPASPLQMPQNLATSSAFQARLKQVLESLLKNGSEPKTEIKVSPVADTLSNQKLSYRQRQTVDQLIKRNQPLDIEPTDDASAEENRYFNSLGFQAVRINRRYLATLPDDQFFEWLLQVVNKASVTLVPMREKHSKTANYSAYGHTTYRIYLMSHALEYVASIRKTI